MPSVSTLPPSSGEGGPGGKKDMVMDGDLLRNPHKGVCLALLDGIQHQC